MPGTVLSTSGTLSLGADFICHVLKINSFSSLKHSETIFFSEHTFRNFDKYVKI